MFLKLKFNCFLITVKTSCVIVRDSLSCFTSV